MDCKCLLTFALMVPIFSFQFESAIALPRGQNHIAVYCSRKKKKINKAQKTLHNEGFWNAISHCPIQPISEPTVSERFRELKKQGEVGAAFKGFFKHSVVIGINSLVQQFCLTDKKHVWNILLQEDQMSKTVKDLQEIAPICLCISICLTYCAAAIL